MKFKVGDKVRVKSLDWYNENKDEDGFIDFNDDEPAFSPSMREFCGQVLTISTINELGYKPNNIVFTFADYMLEDDVIEDNVTKEPLDLTKVLDGCEGIELWSPIFGKVKFESIRMDNIEYPVNIKDNNGITPFTKDGYFIYDHDDTAEIMLFPAKDQRDWSKFKKPRWRAKIGEEYWYVSDIDRVIHCADFRDSIDNTKFEYGNYFRLKEEAEEYAERIRKIFAERL